MSKVVLVTGASSGFGKAIAHRLAEAGHRVFGTHLQPMDDMGRVRMLVLDVNDQASVDGCMNALIAEAGRIDVLINNAGYGICGAVEDTTIEEAQAQLNTNFFGAVRMLRAALPHMRRQGSGRIITTSSMAGLAALPYQPYYSASKFALEGLNEALRLELAGSGIDATTINPGDFKTGFTAARVFTKQARQGIHAAQLDRTLAIYEHDEKNGADPSLVAALMQRLVEAPRVGVRYSVGRLDQRFSMLIKRVIPATLFERLVKATYKLP